MKYQLSEQKVLKKLGIEEFPEFAKTSKEILLEYKDTLDKELKSNEESIRNVYDVYSAIIESLQKELDKSELTFEEKKYIIEQMKDIADKVDKKDSENKKWLISMATVAGAVVIGVAMGLASTLGNNTHVETVDLDDEEV